MGDTQPLADVIRSRERAVLAPGAPGHDHVVWGEAHGATVLDVDGRRLIDFTSGVLVANAGHAHPRVARAIAEQAAKLLNAYDAPHPLRAELAERLVALAGPPIEAVAFLTTGAEAVDACLRIARAATGRYSVVSFTGGFHGKSLSALSVAGLRSTRWGAGPTLPGVLVAPYPDPYRPPVAEAPDLVAACLDLADRLIDANLTEEPAAILVEPYLGAGGCVVPPADFLPRLRDFADRHGGLLIIDEVQAGFGRTGTFFAFQQSGVRPDLVAVAKGIASGVPMSAVLGRRALLAALPGGSLWSTYGGNPLACAAALATLDVLTEPGVIERVGELGERLASAIRDWGDSGIGDVRHAGLSFGIDFVRDRRTKEPDPDRALAVLHAADRHGVIVLPPTGPGGNVLRLAPPLLISDEEVEAGLLALRLACEETKPEATARPSRGLAEEPDVKRAR
jgi:4-aminobutyrate aminotransferase